MSSFIGCEEQLRGVHHVSAHGWDHVSSARVSVLRPLLDQVTRPHQLLRGHGAGLTPHQRQEAEQEVLRWIQRLSILLTLVPSSLTVFQDTCDNSKQINPMIFN